MTWKYYWKNLALKNSSGKNWLYPDFPNVHFLVYTIVSGDSIISHGYKTGRDLRWNIKVAHHEKNDARKGIRCMKNADSMDVESVKAKPFGCSTPLRSLDKFTLPCWTWRCRRRENADFLPLAQELLWGEIIPKKSLRDSDWPKLFMRKFMQNTWGFVKDSNIG